MTMHEKIREASDAKVREVAHKPPTDEATASRERSKDEFYSKALDPSSDWPEPALKGDHLKQVMDAWMPSPPTSPGGSGGGKHRKKGGAAGASPGGGQGGGKRLPVAGVRSGVEVRDEPNDVNHDVGEFMAKTVSPHGHTHTARGAGGFGDNAQ
ncbi:hypothetical protein PLESTB_001113600 [Pleodorina starrii]|uniref:Uncharacterized protein n=1 Tax=Pleodorina starrii TaxID=330485 RepID=A0A9W6BS38_9CHLO|nr:hypothetical protein PLESTM_001350300 [Pleodorina starrii]GLC56496.1 hypothetical protein PLESTB_001113600 [Pleodorina starrii]GLC65932.1 hypothetical protein PLESTF_000363200 [Pleodorina starrii]